MRLVEMNWNPSDRVLRQFSLIALAAFPAAAWLSTAGDGTATLAAAIAGGAMAGLALVYPRGVRPVYVLLCLLALPVGLAVSEAMLMLLFYGILFPLGMIFRIVGRDGLQRRMDPAATCYWQPRRQPGDVASYMRQW